MQAGGRDHQIGTWIFIILRVDNVNDNNENEGIAAVFNKVYRNVRLSLLIRGWFGNHQTYATSSGIFFELNAYLTILVISYMTNNVKV